MAAISFYEASRIGKHWYKLFVLVSMCVVGLVECACTSTVMERPHVSSLTQELRRNCFKGMYVQCTTSFTPIHLLYVIHLMYVPFMILAVCGLVCSQMR